MIVFEKKKTDFVLGFIQNQENGAVCSGWLVFPNGDTSPPFRTVEHGVLIIDETNHRKHEIPPAKRVKLLAELAGSGLPSSNQDFRFSRVGKTPSH